MTTAQVYVPVTRSAAAPRVEHAEPAGDLRLHLRATSDLVARRRAEGDRVTEERMIDHRLAVPVQNAASAREALRRSGYDVELLWQARGEAWLQLTHTTTVDEQTMNALTLALCTLAWQHDGTYRGWRANWFSTDYSFPQPSRRAGAAAGARARWTRPRLRPQTSPGHVAQAG